MRHTCKRALDLLISITALVLLSPIMLGVAILVRLMIGSPVIFRHVRPGLHGQPFTLFKFRTMTNATDATGALLPDEQRECSFGQVLRGASLDELPQLWNVARGDMSLVGPRPLMMRYLARYSPEQARRHEVKPGITGWAQINGRNALSWERKFELDVWYVDNLSLWLDIKILFSTLSRVFRREGISQENQFSSTEFMGPRRDL